MKLRFTRLQVLGVAFVLVAFFAAEFVSGRSFDAGGPRMDQAQAQGRQH
jgi:hypothetical protein